MLSKSHVFFNWTKCLNNQPCDGDERRWIITHFYDVTWLIFETLCPVTMLFREGVHIFNLGSGKGATVLEVIAAFSKASGKVFFPVWL